MRVLIAAILAAVVAQGQEASASVSGRVVNIVNEPVFGVTVDDQVVSSSPDGTFRVVGLRPGTHLLVVKFPGYKFEYLEFDLMAGQDLALPLIEVSLANAGCPGRPHPQRRFLQHLDRGALAGDVRAGEALSLVEVTLTGDGEPRRASTDSKGRYRFEGLRPGIYAVTARRRGFYEEREAFMVEAGFESAYSGYLRLALCPDGTCKTPSRPVQPRCE